MSRVSVVSRVPDVDSAQEPKRAEAEGETGQCDTPVPL